LLAPLVTLIPAVLAVTISGPLVAEAAHHGLKVSPLVQILLIVLVLGAGPPSHRRGWCSVVRSPFSPS
jgi:putative drug exporter of the RND superfamily